MSGESRSLWRRLYEGWLQIAARFGEVQTLVIVGLVYAVAIGPVALGAKVGRRDLLDKRETRGPGTAWRDADTVSRPDLDRAKQTF